MKQIALALLISAQLCGCINARTLAAVGTGLAQGASGASPPSAAATATHTGQSRYGFSVTGLAIINCEYRYYSTAFWRVFPSGTYCPYTVPVQ